LGGARCLAAAHDSVLPSIARSLGLAFVKVRNFISFDAALKLELNVPV